MQFRCPIPVPGREGEPDRGKRFSVRIARELLGGDIDCGKCQKHFNDDVFHRVLLSELLFPEFPVCWFAGAPFFLSEQYCILRKYPEYCGQIAKRQCWKKCWKGRTEAGKRSPEPEGRTRGTPRRSFGDGPPMTGFFLFSAVGKLQKFRTRTIFQNLMKKNMGVQYGFEEKERDGVHGCGR